MTLSLRPCAASCLRCSFLAAASPGALPRPFACGQRPRDRHRSAGLSHRECHRGAGAERRRAGQRPHRPDGGVHAGRAPQSGRFYVLASGISFRQLATRELLRRPIRRRGAERRAGAGVGARSPSSSRRPACRSRRPRSAASVTGLSRRGFRQSRGARRSAAAGSGCERGANRAERAAKRRCSFAAAAPTANRVVMDGVPVEDIGGRFDFGNVATTGIQDVEVYRGPNTVLYGSDAAAGVVALTTPRGSTPFPSLLYEGDAGSFGTYRNQVAAGRHEAAAGLLRRRLQPVDAERHAERRLSRQHRGREPGLESVGEDRRFGSPGATASRRRACLRPTAAIQFDGLRQRRKSSSTRTPTEPGPSTTLSATTGTPTVRYGLVRKREESEQWYPAGIPIAADLLRQRRDGAGANGYSSQRAGADELRDRVSARFIRDSLALASNRDNLFAQTNYEHGPHLGVIAGARYEDERGLEGEPVYAYREGLERDELRLSGAGGRRIQEPLLLHRGRRRGEEPAVRDRGTRRAVAPRGTWCGRARARSTGQGSTSTSREGYQEPTLDQQFGSLYAFLADNGGQSAIAQYGIAPIGAELSRTLRRRHRAKPLQRKSHSRARRIFTTNSAIRLRRCPPRRCRTLLPNLTPAQQQQLEAFLNNNFAYELDLNSMS